MKEQNDLAVQEIIRQRDELAKTLKEIKSKTHHAYVHGYHLKPAELMDLANSSLKKAGIE